MIKLTNISKKYGDFTAVDGVNLEVPRGELFGFLGPNGAGKTTTLRMIAGILRPTGGTVHIAGIDIAMDPIGAKMALGFIPDRPFIYEKLTGAEFLRFPVGDIQIEFLLDPHNEFDDRKRIGAKVLLERGVVR